MSGRITILNRFPDCYQKFFKEWKHGKQAAVHYIPTEGKWERNPETGEVLVSNISCVMTVCLNFYLLDIL